MFDLSSTITSIVIRLDQINVISYPILSASFFSLLPHNKDHSVVLSVIFTREAATALQSPSKVNHNSRMTISVKSPADFHVHLRQGSISKLVTTHVRKGGFDLAYVMVSITGILLKNGDKF